MSKAFVNYVKYVRKLFAGGKKREGTEISVGKINIKVINKICAIEVQINNLHYLNRKFQINEILLYFVIVVLKNNNYLYFKHSVQGVQKLCCENEITVFTDYFRPF